MQRRPGHSQGQSRAVAAADLVYAPVHSIKDDVNPHPLPRGQALNRVLDAVKGIDVGAYDHSGVCKVVFQIYTLHCVVTAFTCWVVFLKCAPSEIREGGQRCD